MVTSKNDSSKTDTLEKWVKILSFLLSIVIFFWGVLQYKLDNEREFRKYIFEEQSRIYSKYLSLCAELATTDKDSTLTKPFFTSYAEFEKIHFGEMTLVQDTLVFSLATKFYTDLNTFRQRQSPITNNQLQITLNELSKNCRRSLMETWTGNFKKIFDK